MHPNLQILVKSETNFPTLPFDIINFSNIYDIQIYFALVSELIKILAIDAKMTFVQESFLSFIALFLVTLSTSNFYTFASAYDLMPH